MQDEPLYGIRGWLLVFCLYMGLQGLLCLSMISAFGRMTELAAQNGVSTPWYGIWVIGTLAMIIGCVSISSVFCVFDKGPLGLTWLHRILKTFTIFSMVIFGLSIVVLAFSMGDATQYQTGALIPFPALLGWYGYFKVSKRVRDTFGSNI
jgi:hypothetical protein